MSKLKEVASGVKERINTVTAVITVGSLFFVACGPNRHYTNQGSSVVYSLSAENPCIVYLAVSSEGVSAKDGMIGYKDARTGEQMFAANANTYNVSANRHERKMAYVDAPTQPEARQAVLDILRDDPNWPRYELCEPLLVPVGTITE